MQGERLGRYEVLDEVGRGAMGRVYRARDPEIDRIVALKVMQPEGGVPDEAAEEWRRRFQREARAAGRLAHPNIVTIFDVGEERGRSYVVMEFVAGRTLDAILRAEGPLPAARVLAIGEQVAAALDHAHQQGIVHRDIKPANILLTSAGVAKVMDFGIARVARDPTQTAGLWGSPSYMSPEQVQGRSLDGRSDLFSLAAVLYELFSGQRPFPGETITTIAYRIVHEPCAPLTRLKPDLPAALDAWVARAMAKEPGRRYQKAPHLARDLRAALEGGALRSPGAATTKRVSPPATGRRRAAAWTAAGLGCVVLAAVALLLLRPSRPAVSPPPPPAPVAAPVQPVPPPDEARAEAERLAAERKRLAAERERLAREQAALEAARRQAAPAEARAPQAPVPEEPREPLPHRLRFVGNQVVPSEDLEALARDLMPLTRESLRTLLERVREHYTAQGYVLARAVPHPPKDGVVEIELVEGWIRSLRPVGFSPQDHQAVLEAFRPVLQVGVVRRSQIAEALRRLGERHRIVARLRFEPGTEPGTVVLVVERRAFGGAGREQAPPRVPPPQESR